jgi:hypothetical protein
MNNGSKTQVNTGAMGVTRTEEKSQSVVQNLRDVPLKPSKIGDEFLLWELGVIQNLSELCAKLAEESVEKEKAVSK